MMVSLTATLSGFGPEMQVTRGLSAENTKVIEAYWSLWTKRSLENMRAGSLLWSRKQVSAERRQNPANPFTCETRPPVPIAVVAFGIALLAPSRSEAHPDECPWCLPPGIPLFFYATRSMVRDCTRV